VSDNADFDWDEPADSSAGRVHPDLSPKARILLGVLTFWPVLYILLFLFMIAALIFLASSASESFMDGIFPVLLVFHLGTILLTFAMTIYYTVYVVTDARFVGAPRIVWLLLVLLGGILGQGIFYVLWFWMRDPAVLSLGGTASTGSAPSGPAPPPLHDSDAASDKVS